MYTVMQHIFEPYGGVSQVSSLFPRWPKAVVAFRFNVAEKVSLY